MCGAGVRECMRAVLGYSDTPPSSAVVNTQGRESGGSWFETCSGVWYPRRRPCGAAINTLVDLIKLAKESPSFMRKMFEVMFQSVM